MERGEEDTWGKEAGQHMGEVRILLYLYHDLFW
jgi:hypothetical protein